MVDSNGGGMAYYQFSDVMRLAHQGKVIFATTDAYQDAAELDLEERMPEVIRLLTGIDFNNVVPDCGTNYGLIDADSYLLCIDSELMVRVPPGKGLTIYLKLAIHIPKDMTDERCLLISVHKSIYDK